MHAYCFGGLRLIWIFTSYFELLKKKTKKKKPAGLVPWDMFRTFSAFESCFWNSISSLGNKGMIWCFLSLFRSCFELYFPIIEHFEDFLKITFMILQFFQIYTVCLTEHWLSVTADMILYIIFVFPFQVQNLSSPA